MYPDEDAETIASISLLVVCANAISGSLAYARQWRIDYRSGLSFAAGTFPGAIGGALVVGQINRQVFEGMFAVLLVGLGIYLLVRRQGGAIVDPVTGWGVVNRRITDNEGNTFVYSFQPWKGIVISVGVGFLSSLLGIGGGVIHVPIMTSLLHFPVHIAVATSQFVLALMAGQGTAVHFLTGTLAWNDPLLKAALLAAGAIPGAQLGARLSRRLRGSVVVKALSVALILVGGRLAVRAVFG